jgi:hypothetical protein
MCAHWMPGRVANLPLCNPTVSPGALGHLLVRGAQSMYRKLLALRPGNVLLLASLSEGGVRIPCSGGELSRISMLALRPPGGSRFSVLIWLASFPY